MLDSIRAIYNAIKEDKKISNTFLKDLGFTFKEINEMVDSHILKPSLGGNFKVLSSKILYLYGEKIYNQDKEAAIMCFEKSLEFDKKDSLSAFRLFYYYVEKKDIKKSIPYFEIYYMETKDLDYYTEFYLYLLNILGYLPLNYVEYAKYLKYNDFKIPLNTEDRNIYLLNKVRLSASNQKFYLALDQINEALENPLNQNINNYLIRNLLNFIILEKRNSNNTIRALIKSKRYKEAIKVLTDLEASTNLQTYQIYLLALLKDAYYMTTTGKVPTLIPEIANDLETAIKCKNYALALKYATEHLDTLEYNKDKNLIYILLLDIKELIEKIEDNDFLIQEDDTYDYDLVFSCEEESSEVKKENSNNNYLADTIYLLLNNNIEDAYYSLDMYLKSIDSLEYEFLIVDLIKISILESDLGFKKALLTLASITKSDYQIEISPYIISYYESLGNNKIEIARLYLDILKNFKKLGIEFTLEKNASKVLEKTN